MREREQLMQKKNYETIIELQRSNIRKLKYDIFES